MPVFAPVPVFAPPFTSSLDRRSTRASKYGKETIVGDGRRHRDIISFSLTSDTKPADETLVIRNPVRAEFWRDYATDRLKALFEELSDLQESRTWAPDVAMEEMPTRQMTLDMLAEVIRARPVESIDGDEEEEEEDDDDDDDDSKST